MNEPVTGTDRVGAARRTLELLDLTSLGDDDSPDDVRRLCQAATTPHGPVAAVCVWPRFVALAADQLADTPVRICAVANFPAGADDHQGAVADAKAIVADGGTEVDVVVPWPALAAGQRGAVRALVGAVREAVGPDILIKAILETGQLSRPDLIAAAADEALVGGADFLKTSTGKTSRSATPEAARLLLQLVADRGYSTTTGLKISGGVRNLDTAATYLDLADEVMGPRWVGPNTFRFGASGLLDDLRSTLDAGP